MASGYFPRPTYISLEKMSDGSDVLAVKMAQYAQRAGLPGHSTEYQIRFLRSEISSYVVLLNKYDEWREKAVNRSDAITREIGRAKAWTNAGNGELKLLFHSGNSGNHFLAVSFCALGTCADDRALMFDAANVNELRNLLLNWQAGKLNHMNVAAMYN